MTLRLYILLLFLLPVSGLMQTMAQNNRPVRLEIPVKDDTEIYKVVPCSSNGVMVIYLSSETDERGNMLWIAAFLDRSLKEIWRKSIPLPRGFVLAEALYAGNHMIGFWYSPKGELSENLRIADVNVADSSHRIVGFNIPSKSEFSQFDISERIAVAGLNTRDDQSMLIVYNLQSGLVSSTEQNIQGNVVIESLNLDEASGIVSAILRTTGSARKREYYLVKTHENGQKISELKLSRFGDNNLINTAFSYPVDATTDLVIGSFGHNTRTRMINGTESLGVSSTGFFSVLIKNNVEINNQFYEFTDFQNFYRYLRRPSDLTIRRGTNKAERSQKDLSIDHDLITHDVFRWKNEYVFIAEAFYPEYRTVTTMVYDYYGRPYPSTYSVFEGYRYLTTFISGFDSTGSMKWNADFELRNMLTQDIREKVLAWEDTEGLVLSYPYDARIASRTLGQGGEQSSIDYADIAPLGSRDKIYTDSNSQMMFWYGNYFLVFGYQNLRNSYQSERNNKNVFYINKLAFR